MCKKLEGPAPLKGRNIVSRKKVQLGGSAWASITFCLVDQSSPIFSPNRRWNVVDISAVQIFDMSMRSWDIRDQSRKLSKIAPNFGHFCPPKYCSGHPLVKLVSTWSPRPRATSPGKISWGYAHYPQSYRRVYVEFKPNFKCSPLKFFGGPSIRFIVCASKPWPVPSACKNFRGQYLLRTEI